MRAAWVARSTAWACRTSAAAGQAIGALVAVLLLASVKLTESVSGTCSKDLCGDWALIRALRIIIKASVSVFHLLLLVVITLFVFVALALLALLLLVIVAALAILLFLFLVFKILNLSLEEFDLAIGGSQALLQLGILGVFTLLGFQELFHGAFHLSKVFGKIGKLVLLELRIAVLAHVLDHLCSIILGLHDFLVFVFDFATKLLNLTFLGASLHALGSLGSINDLFGLVTKMAASTFVFVLAAGRLGSAAGTVGGSRGCAGSRSCAGSSSSILAFAFCRNWSLAVALEAATKVLSVELMVAPSVPEGSLSLGLDSLLVC